MNLIGQPPTSPRPFLHGQVRPRTPNFFVVGAPKAGTTSLHRYLEQHPQVYMSPIKEPHFFASDRNVSQYRADFYREWHRKQRGLERYLNGPMSHRRGGHVLEWENYLKLFRNARDETAIGEASVGYLRSATAARSIRDRLPDARIIILLRQPAERAFSEYLMYRRDGRLRTSFRETWEIDLRAPNREVGRCLGLLENGLYSSDVARYMQTFPKNRVRTYLLDDLIQHPLDCVSDIYRFLEVDPRFEPRLDRHNVAAVPRMDAAAALLQLVNAMRVVRQRTPAALRPLLRRLFYRKDRPQLHPDDRTYVTGRYYEEDIKRLAPLIERDLSHWLV